jgi:hypothetical protein
LNLTIKTFGGAYMNLVEVLEKYPNIKRDEGPYAMAQDTKKVSCVHCGWIKKDKNKIANDIKKKQQEARAIDKQIDRLIRQAIAEANRKAAAERAKQKAAAII